MRKLLVILMLCLVMYSNISFADFKWVESYDFDDSIGYEDWYNSRVMGKSITFWRMRDYTTLQDDGRGQFMSTLVLQILDCSDLSLTRQFIENYSGEMGEGELIYIDKLSKDEREKVKEFLKTSTPNYLTYNNICENTFVNGLGGTQDWWLELYEVTNQR
jgi:hypothetical protein